MKQNPSWEADSHSASQEIPSFIWNPTVQYRVHKIPPPAPNLSHMNPVHNLFQINFNIIFPSTSRSPVTFPSDFPIKIMYALPTYPMRATRIANLIWSE
jgi:hypothetical protein